MRARARVCVCVCVCVCVSSSNRLQHVAHFSDRMHNAVVHASTHFRRRLVEDHEEVDWLGQYDPVPPRSAWPGPLRAARHRRTCMALTRSRCGALPGSVYANTPARAQRRYRNRFPHAVVRTHAKPLRGTPGFGACHDRCMRAALFRNRVPMVARAALASVRRSTRTLDHRSL